MSTAVQPAVTPVGPRAVGEVFVYRGMFHTPKTCIVMERYDDNDREMRDGMAMFADHTTVAFFDWELHDLDCPGTTGHVLDRAPCPCGAWPGDPNHKFRRLARTKDAVMGKLSTESGQLTLRAAQGEVTSGPEHPHVPMSYEDGVTP